MTTRMNSNFTFKGSLNCAEDTPALSPKPCQTLSPTQEASPQGQELQPSKCNSRLRSFGCEICSPKSLTFSGSMDNRFISWQKVKDRTSKHNAWKGILLAQKRCFQGLACVRGVARHVSVCVCVCHICESWTSSTWLASFQLPPRHPLSGASLDLPPAAL